MKLCQAHKDEWNNETSHSTTLLPSNYDNFLICEVEIKIPQPVLEHTSQSLKVVNLWVLKQAQLPQPIPNQGRLETSKGLPCGSAGKESACNAGDLGSIPGLGRFPAEEKGYPFQYSGLENSMDCIVHGVAKSWTQLSDFHFPFTFTFQRHIWLLTTGQLWHSCQSGV